MYQVLTRRLISFYHTTSSLFTRLPFSTAISSMLISTASIPFTMFPAPTMPSLSGKYQSIGVSSFSIKQSPPPSTTSSPPSPPVELVVKVFYPSSTSSPPPPSFPYMTPLQAESVAAFAGIPKFLFSHLPRIKIRAIDSPPLLSSPTPLPLILYSHGLGGLPETYTVQACDLASRGFVVFMPTHNDHSAAISVLPDGRVVAYEPARGRAEQAIRSKGLVQRVRELVFLMDFLTASPGPEVPFNGEHLKGFLSHCDTSQVALIGHSFGAATVVATASYEQRQADKAGRPSRVKAVVAHDQWMLPVYEELKDIRLTTPILITASQHFREWDANYTVLRELYSSFPTPTDSRMLMVRASRHSNFSDVGLWSPVFARWSNNIGKIDHKKCWRLLDDYNALWCGRALGWKMEGEVSEILLDENNKPDEVEWLH